MYRNRTILGEPELKVLELFVDLEPHYFAEISRATGLTRPRTMRVLRRFKSLKILNTEKKANTIYYSLNKECLLTFPSLAVVEYSRTSAFLEKRRTLNRAIRMLKEKFANRLIMALFGSVVKGYATEKSDIDVLLVAERFSKKEIRELEDLTAVINGRTGLRISPYLMTLNELREKNDLVKEIISNHLLSEGAELFYKVIL